MAKLLDSINWMVDGERATANVLNRPLKELITKMDNNEFDVMSKFSGITIETNELHSAVQMNDFVYQGDDSLFHRTLGGDNTADKVLGIYQVIEGNYTIVFAGPINYSGLTVGSTYYLSDTTGEEGGITNISYPGAVKVGVALPNDKLLLEFGVSAGNASNGLSIELDDTITVPTEHSFVYRLSDTEFALAQANGTDAAHVIGIYQVENGRNFIKYNGEISYDAFTLIGEQLVVGMTYYLSPTTAGVIQKEIYPGAIKVGIATSVSTLLIDIDSASGSDDGMKLDGITIDGNVQDGDFVYKTSGGEIHQALVDGTDKENVIGIYKVIDNRATILYNGIVPDFTDAESNPLVVGSYYYLSPTVLGGIQVDSYPGAIKVGIANSTTELLVDIDKAPSSSGDEELEYQFLLNNSSFNQAYFNVFTELNTITENNDSDPLNVVYSALNTSYLIKNTWNIETPTNLLGDGNVTEFYSFQVSANIVGDVTTQFSVNDGVDYTDVPDTGYIKIKAGVTNFKLRFVANEDNVEIKSFGVLYEEAGFIGTNRIKLREYITCTEDIAEGTEVFLPNGQYYTMNGVSLNIRVEGLALVPGVDYTEETDKSVKFTQEILLGDVIEFEEVYGFVDLSEDNILRVDDLILLTDKHETQYRLDKVLEILDINNIDYDIDDNIEMIEYSTGNKEDWVRDGVLTHIDYYDTDGITKLAINEFTYDGSGRLLTTTWTNL